MSDYYENETAEAKNRLMALFILLAIVIVFSFMAIVPALDLELFEDGSWILGNLSGCLPGAICNQ